MIAYLAESTFCMKQCQTLNPFLPIIQKDGVALNMYPQLSNQQHRCTGEWSVHGTCCTYDSIVRYALQDKQKMDNYRIRMESHLSLITATFQKIQRLASALSKRNLGLTQEYKDFLYFMESSENKVHRDNLLGRGQLHDTPQEFEECISTFQNARSTSLCSICSGRSSRWFEGSKAKMSPGQCGYLIERCSKTFKTAFGIIESLGIFMVKIHSLQIDRIMTASDRNSAVRLQSAIKQLAGLDIFDIIMRYQHASTPDQKISSAAEICSSLVTLAHVPFLSGLESMIGSAARYIEHWFGHCSRLAADGLKLTSANNWSSRRLLQNGLKFLEPSGDVLVSFTAFSSTTISPLNFDSRAVSIKMNLQMKFP